MPRQVRRCRNNIENLITNMLLQDGMVWILFAALIAGLVRGFSGFGTAMVFLPIASQYLTPFEAIASLAIMEFLGTFAVMRNSWSDAEKRFSTISCWNVYGHTFCAFTLGASQF